MRRNNISSFTLVELLIVIAILTILAAAVVIVINPGEMLAQARDAERISSIESIKKSIDLFILDNPSVSLGTASKIYISISSATAPSCDAAGLPALPSGWSYNCVTAANLRSTNGTGWIPLDLSTIKGGSPLPSLPVDPVNTANQYYAFSSSGLTYQLDAAIESRKQVNISEKDGGVNPFVFETGSGLSLIPIDISRSYTRDPRFEISAITDNTTAGAFGSWQFGSWAGFRHYLNTVLRPDGTTGKVLRVEKTTAGNNDIYEPNWVNNTVVGGKYNMSIYARGDGGTVILQSQSASYLSFTPTSEWKRYSVDFTRASTGTYNYIKTDSINGWVELWYPQVVPL